MVIGNEANLQKIFGFIPIVYFFIIIPIIILLILFIVLLIIKVNNIKDLKFKFKLYKTLHQIEKEEHNDIKGKKILEIIKSSVKGDGYYLYVYDNESNQYRLTKLVFKEEKPDTEGFGVDVGYGRLLRYARESYAPPLVIPEIVLPDKPVIRMEGRFPLVIIPVKEKKGFISVSIARKKHLRNTAQLEYIASEMEVLFDGLIKKNSTEHLTKKITDSMKANVYDNVLEIIRYIMGGDACFFVNITNNYFELLMASGFPKTVEETLRNDLVLGININKIIADKETVSINFTSAEYHLVPDYLKTEGYKYFFVINAQYGMVYTCYKNKPEDSYFKNYRMKLVRDIIEKHNENSKSIKKRRSSEPYLSRLIEVAKDFDYEDPYTVGHSELMAHFSSVIANEMKMKKDEINNIVRAANLINIGALTLPESLLMKEGLYNKLEYELMKRHTEAGAYIIEYLTGISEIALLIKHHHESMDGTGYPDGLSGHEIPTGARILSVVQYFLSKISGRNYREPQTFDRIVFFLEREAGKTLDPVIIMILLDWFKKKQANPMIDGKTLGPCWEMKCTSKKICNNCPAYEHTEKYCWEYENTNCGSHGSVCNSCYVYTEFLYRKISISLKFKELHKGV